MKLKYTLIGITVIAAVSLISINLYSNSKYNIEYTDIEYNIETQENYNLSEYMISMEEFIELKKNERREQLSRIKPLIANNTYKSMVKGIETEYFQAYCISQYEVMYRNIQNMMAQMAYITKEYDSITDINKLDKCIVEDCVVTDYINKHMKGSLKDLLMDTHYKYESLIAYNAESIESANEDYITMFYNEYLCTDLSHLSDINVSIVKYPLGYENKTDKELETLKFWGIVKTTHLGIKDKELLKELDLYKCHNYYDSNLMEIATDSMYSFTLSDTFEPVYSRRIIYTLCGLNEEDRIYVEYTVDNSRHTNIKTKDEMREELESKAKIYEAQLDVYDTILNSIKEENPSTTEETDELDIEENTNNQ